MPYKSVAQEKYFNANRAKLESQGVDVAEFNAASKGKKLPAKLKGEAHSYDSNRPKRPVVSRYSK
jgi:hypothetical protein